MRISDWSSDVCSSDLIVPVVERALAAGVGTLVTICTKLSEFDRIEAIGWRFARVYCSVGVHPHEAGKEGQQTPDRLIELAGRDKVAGTRERSGERREGKEVGRPFRFWWAPYH